ncbi:abscission/NoCut checkpoint regulator isoform X2 [Parasteatoda tepidariorum]|uniref:abscission/NoCut checkpoint regulator isoform X2 n=1 Tax=Parasteatoda tepidariorum TaxID=114398 RepID=UPI00077FAB9D|nr:abscission/NoCut checkpoint regulator isoform X2 [Parasteatoda tepidariorum]
MPCSACGTEFGIFKKEIGCENCGFAFCGKCCRKQEVQSESGDLKKYLICNACFLQKTKGRAATTADISPPLAHKKRMSLLKKQSYSVDSATHVQLQSEWCDKDIEIAERLQKLKSDRIKADLPSNSEIEERIAKLKGMDPSKYKAPPIEVFRPADRRSSFEKASDLMKEMSEKVELDSKIVKPEDEIEARLAKLRAMDSETSDVNISKPESQENLPENLLSKYQEPWEGRSEEEQIKYLLEKYKVPTSSTSKSHEDVEMNEEEEAEKLVEKLMASNVDDEMEGLDSLNEQESEKSLPSDDQNSPEEEEFPWCVICSQDAKIRCFGCDRDLYCLRCFRECHDSLDIKDHKTCPFLPPKEPMV